MSITHPIKDRVFLTSRRNSINESLLTSRNKLQNVFHTSIGSSRLPQSSPLRQPNGFDYLPRIAGSSPLRNDPTMRPFPALPSNKGRPSFNPLPYEEPHSHSDYITSPLLPMKHDGPSPRLANPTPEVPKANPRNTSPSRRVYRDAYDAFPVSPDSAWSSLPTATKRQRPPVEKKSGNFKIARLVDRKSPEGAIGTTTEYSGSSKITTYLPPPRSEPKHRSDTERESKRGVTLWNVKRVGHSSVFSSQKTHPDNATPVRPIQSSNTQGLHHEEELHVPFDSENLGARYKKVRDAARKVRLMSVLFYGLFFSLRPVAKTPRDATMECSRLAQLWPSFS